jgi:hypothetical protein
MMQTFTRIGLAFMIGIGSGAPSARHDVRLGDVVVGSSWNGISNVFQYDFGKAIQDQALFKPGPLNQPPIGVRTAVVTLRSSHELGVDLLEEEINMVLQKEPRLREQFSRPPDEPSRNFRDNAAHEHSNYQSEVELRVEEALDYLGQFPTAQIAAVATKFDIPRSRLNRRRQGSTTKAGRPVTDTKLTREEEVAICRYIDRLGSGMGHQGLRLSFFPFLLTPLLLLWPSRSVSMPIALATADTVIRPSSDSEGWCDFG